MVLFSIPAPFAQKNKLRQTSLTSGLQELLGAGQRFFTYFQFPFIKVLALSS